VLGLIMPVKFTNVVKSCCNQTRKSQNRKDS
jgi:hypothetical protein